MEAPRKDFLYWDKDGEGWEKAQNGRVVFKEHDHKNLGVCSGEFTDQSPADLSACGEKLDAGPRVAIVSAQPAPRAGVHASPAAASPARSEQTSAPSIEVLAQMRRRDS